MSNSEVAPGGDDTVTEFDLLAYADGRLEGDLAQRALVERHLSRHPEQAERVASFRAQNEALVRVGAARLEAPVPQRLLDALQRDRQVPAWKAARAAALAALVAGSTAAGWFAGTGGEAGDGAAEAFAAGALLDYRQSPATSAAPADAAPAGAAAESGPERPAHEAGSRVMDAGVLPAHDLDPQALSQQGVAPIAWLRRRIAVEIDSPDLGAEGFSLVETRRVEFAGETAMRLDYRRGDGQRAVLYLRPRWKRAPETFGSTERGGVTVLHWLDGPLAIALVTDGADREQVQALARQVRRAVGRPELVEPAPQAAEVSQDARVTDSAGAEPPGPLGDALLLRPEPSL